MKSYRARRDEIAVIDHDGSHRVTQHWPLAARAWPRAAPEIPTGSLVRLAVGNTELKPATTLAVIPRIVDGTTKKNIRRNWFSLLPGTFRSGHRITP